MPIPLVLDRSSDVLLQSQIFDQIQHRIRDGQLCAGTRLPASRALAEALGVSRNTVILAYERLADEGYIESRGVRGTFVSSRLPIEQPHEEVPVAGTGSDTRPSPVTTLPRHRVTSPNDGVVEYDFWIGRPDGRLFPFNAWRRLMLRRLSGPRTRFGEYCPPAGLLALRRAIAEHIGITRGIRAEPEQIVITGGTQEGISLAAGLLVEPGAVAVVEDPCYTGATAVLESRRAKLHPVAVDDSGIRVDDLPATGAAVAFLTPSHQYPLGATLSLERRTEVLAWASRVGAYIIEDDYDSDFRYTGAPLSALKGMDEPQRVIYLGTFSKSLGPGLRLGFAVLPPELMGAFTAAKATLNNAEPWLEQSALAEFISDGSFAAHIRRLRRLYMARRDCLIEGLSHFGTPVLGGADAGFHLSWELPSHLPPLTTLVAAARRHGVGIYHATRANSKCFATRSALSRTMLLGYAALNEEEIRTAIDRIIATADDC